MIWLLAGRSPDGVRMNSSAVRLHNALIAISLSLSTAGCGSGGEPQPRIGYVVDVPVSGMDYQCGLLTGTTGSDGSFHYASGTACSFTVGNVMVGAVSAVPSDGIVTPYDLARVSRTDALHANAIAIAQFLQSLDDGTQTTHINIPASVAAELFTIAPTRIVWSAATPTEVQVQLSTLVATATRGTNTLIKAEVAAAKLNTYLQTALPRLDRTAGVVPPAASTSSTDVPKLAAAFPTTLTAVNGRVYFSATSDVDAIGYWVVLPANAGSPNEWQVISGLDTMYAAATLSGQGNMAAASTASFEVTGLDNSTSYILSFVVANAKATSKVTQVTSSFITTGVEFKSVWAGDYHTLAVKTDGTLWGWGANAKGQIGDGTTANKSLPIQIGKEANWAEAAAGDIISVAVKTDGTLWAWGYNQDGELGDGTTVNRSAPIQIGRGAYWAKVYSGGYHSFAANRDGTLWGWGQNGSGQIGDGTTVLRNTPVQIGSDRDWAIVSAGDIFTVAIKTNGTLWAWGDNPYGQLGDGTTMTKRIVPVQIGSDSDWAKVSAGTGHTVAVKRDGTLWGWGANADGQLGDGTTVGKTVPIQIGSDTNWARVYAGVKHTMAIKTDGTLWGWGDNSVYCQLADPVLMDKLVPFQIDSNANWAAIAAGWGHSVAVRTDGTLWAWGNNEENQLGNGTTDAKCRPIQIGD